MRLNHDHHYWHLDSPSQDSDGVPTQRLAGHMLQQESLFSEQKQTFQQQKRSSKNVFLCSEYPALKTTMAKIDYLYMLPTNKLVDLVYARLVVGEILKDSEGCLDWSVGHQLHLDLVDVPLD